MNKEVESVLLEIVQGLKKMQEDLAAAKGRDKGFLGSSTRGSAGGQWTQRQDNSANKVFPSSLLEAAIQNFPKFDGSEPKLWIRKCDRAFLLHPIPQDQKVLVASSQFEKKAKIWYQLVFARRVGVTWREFSEAVLDRFWNMTQEESTDEETLTTKQEDVEEKGKYDKPTEKSSVTESEGLPVEPEAFSTLDSTAENQALRENPSFEAVQELPDESPVSETVDEQAAKAVKEVEEETPTIEMAKKLQAVTIKASIEAMETKSWPKPTPNRPTLPYPDQRGTIIPSHQNLSTLSNPNQNTPPIQTQIFHAINQNTAANLVANRPNPWPNKLPKLTYFIRPKPWPDEPPIHTTTNTNRPTLWPGAIGNFGSPKPRNNIEENNKEGKAYHVLKRVHHRLWPTLERAAAAARLPTPFPGEDRRRSRPVSQLMVLPEFDPGDFRSKEDKGRISFEFNGYLGHFGRIFEGNRRRIEENSRWFSEKRRIGIVLEENRRQIEDEVAGLSKKKKIWANSELGIWIEDLGDRFVEEEDVLQSSCETASFCVSLLGIRNGGVLKEISVGLIGLAEALWRTGSIRLGPSPDLGQLGHLQLISISVPYPLGHNCN